MSTMGPDLRAGRPYGEPQDPALVYAAREALTNELRLDEGMSEGTTATGRPRSIGGRVLVVVCGTSAREHDLPSEGAVIIGRGPDADVFVDHPTLSRAHARLTLGPHVTIADCESRNGTVVAGRALRRGEVVLVAPGTPIELGDAVLFIRGADDAPGDLLASTGASHARAASIDRIVQRLARSEVPVLLAGDPGVGKTYIAGRLHQLSDRSSGSLVTLATSRATAPEEVEHAVRLAHAGTLIIREPALATSRVQATLLAALAEAGDLVRTVTVTGRDLHAATRSGELDVALFHRLAGVSVVVPPLRARVGELASLANMILAELTVVNQLPRMFLSPEAITVLSRHTWPGNVRELRNALARAVLLGKGRVLGAAHFDLEGAEPAAGASGGTLAEAVDEAEHRRILEALRQCDGNQTRAAKALGISRGTLIARLERFGVPRPRK